MPVPGNSGSVCSSISGPRPGPLLLRQPQVRDSLSLKSSKLCPWMPTFCCFKSGPHLFKCTGHGSTDVSCSPPDDFTSESSRVFGCCRFSNRGGGGGRHTGAEREPWSSSPNLHPLEVRFTLVAWATTRIPGKAHNSMGGLGCMGSCLDRFFQS